MIWLYFAIWVVGFFLAWAVFAYILIKLIDSMVDFDEGD